MGKVIFQISYEVRTDKRPEYLALAKKLRSEYEALGVNYDVCEVQGQENAFSEIFTCASPEEYEELDDRTNDSVQMLQDKLARCMNGKMRYTTMHELE